MPNIAINGLGRIGRSIFRLLTTTRLKSSLNVVALNDIQCIEQCAYLIKYDSVFGSFPGLLSHDEHTINVNNQSYRFTSEPDLSKLDLGDVDIVLECTGKTDNRNFIEAGLRAGAKRILISGPSSFADIVIVLGANQEKLTDQQIVSNASCTINALAPLVSLIHDAFGVACGHMTTIHCYTGSQPTVDAPRIGLERSRAAALSIVPTSTSAGSLVSQVLPHLKNRITTRSVRVPTASVSAVDLSLSLESAPSVLAINEVIRNANQNLIGTTNEALVSCDLRQRAESIIVALPETRVAKDGYCRVFGWYDNEWGYSNRVIDLAEMMVKSKLDSTWELRS